MSSSTPPIPPGISGVDEGFDDFLLSTNFKQSCQSIPETQPSISPSNSNLISSEINNSDNVNNSTTSVLPGTRFISAESDLLTCGQFNSSRPSSSSEIVGNPIFNSELLSDLFPPLSNLEHDMESDARVPLSPIQQSMTRFKTFRDGLLHASTKEISNSVGTVASNVHGCPEQQVPVQTPANNSTLASANKGKVIIIEVTDLLSSTLLNNPFKINEHLNNSDSPFLNLAVADLRVNRKKKLIVLEVVDELSCDFVLSLPEIKKLGIFNVRCYQPNSDTLIHGVIGPIDLEADITILKDNMIFSSNSEIYAAERLKRKMFGKLEDSLSLKLTFKCKDLPDNVKIFGLFFKIRPYIPPPVQCFQCQRYGHTAGSCKANVRCLLCSGNHKKEQCTAISLLCANCKESHVANSKDCKFMKIAREVETIKVQEKVSHSEARNRVQTRHCNTLTQPNQYSFSGDTSWARVVSSGLTERRASTSIQSGSNPGTIYNHKCNCKVGKNSATIGTQTMDETGEALQSVDFFKNLRNFIVEVLSTNFTKENENSKLALADSAIRNHFNVDLRKTVPEVQNPESAPLKRKIIHTSSAEEPEVLSSEENSEFWKTMEKKQVRVQPKRAKKKKNGDKGTNDTSKKKNSKDQQ